MLELIILGFVFYVGYNIGQIVLSWQLRDIVIREAKREGIIDDDLNFIDEQSDTPTVHKLRIQKINGMLYLYGDDDRWFVCQANTIDELAKLAKEYKNVKYAAVIDDEKVYTFVDGKVEIKL
jgi:hypothetical protein